MGGSHTQITPLLVSKSPLSCCGLQFFISRFSANVKTYGIHMRHAYILYFRAKLGLIFLISKIYRKRGLNSDHLAPKATQTSKTNINFEYLPYNKSDHITDCQLTNKYSR